MIIDLITLESPYLNSTMSVKKALILAAGFGTRMGEIGKIRPKVTWPIFEKTLLELQVLWARKLEIEDIYINLHYQNEEILNLYKENPIFKNVCWLYEPTILDVGGAIHNLARQPENDYQGKVLILNADLFLDLDLGELNTYSKKLETHSCLLFTEKVKSDSGYNGLDLNSTNAVKGVIKNNQFPRDVEITTYTGVSIINLSLLKPVGGVSSFFSSICHETQGSNTIVDKSKSEYWDFGTSNRYYSSMFKILSQNSKSKFYQFLKSVGGIDENKIGHSKKNYHSSYDFQINLSPWCRLPSNQMNVINLGGNKNLDFLKNDKQALIYQDIVQEII